MAEKHELKPFSKPTLLSLTEAQQGTLTNKLAMYLWLSLFILHFMTSEEGSFKSSSSEDMSSQNTPSHH